MGCYRELWAASLGDGLSFTASCCVVGTLIFFWLSWILTGSTGSQGGKAGTGKVEQRKDDC